MRYLAYTLFASVVLSVSTTHAAACKGLEATSCKAKSCTWVAGYQRKDGRLTKGYCRAKPAAKPKVEALAVSKSK